MLKRYKIAAIPPKTKIFYSFVFLFIVGVCFGTGSGDSEALRALADGYSAAQNFEAAADNFFKSLSADAVLLAVVLLLGFSSVSAPVLILVPFFKGLGVGAAASALYIFDPAPASILKSFIGFSVTAAISSFVLIIASQSALRLSVGLFSHLRGRCENFDLVSEGKKYGLKFLLFAVIIVINAVLDTLLSILLC